MNIHYVSICNNFCQTCMFHLQSLSFVHTYLNTAPVSAATVDVLAKKPVSTSQRGLMHLPDTWLSPHDLFNQVGQLETGCNLQ